MSKKTLNLQSKLLGLFIIFSCLPLVIVSVYSSYNLRDTVYNEKRDSLSREIDVALSIVQKYYSDYKSGLINETTAKNQSLSILKELRYGPVNKDYFFVFQVINSKPIMLMHPFTPQLVGQDLSSYKDPNGVYLFNEMADVVNKDGSGFVQYSWQYYDNANLIVPKLSFVKEFSTWNWIVGTGFYIQDVDSTMLNEMLLFTGLITGTLIVIFISVYFVSKSISKPIIALSKSNANLSKGDLRENLSFTSRNDEIGLLIQSYNNSLIFFKDIISELKANSELLFVSANDIASSSEEVSASSQEISSITQQMSKGSQEQATTVLKSVNQLNNFENMFKEKINGIKGTSRLIETITSQVNMLALNASIEAARAGEYGRGFAVVADNIRKLADSTKESLTEVNKKINDIEYNLSESLVSVKSMIDSVSAISEETASGSEQASAATEEQSATLEELSSKTQELSLIASKLQNIIDKFTLE